MCLYILFTIVITAVLVMPRCGIKGDELIIAKTLYGEARGESLQGKKAVASVIYNRAVKKYGKATMQNLSKICLAPKQFSCWNGGRIKVRKGKAWNECKLIAHSMGTGVFTPTGPWDHFYNPKLASPFWASSLTNLKVVGNHLFGVCN